MSANSVTKKTIKLDGSGKIADPGKSFVVMKKNK